MLRKLLLLIFLVQLSSLAVDQGLMEGLSRLGAVFPKDILELYGNFSVEGLEFYRDIYIIPGESMDSVEHEMANIFTKDLGTGVYVYQPDQLNFSNPTLWESNFIIIGGPEHNSLTKWLMNSSTFNFTQRDSNRPKVIIQAAEHNTATILLISSAYSYPPGPKVKPVEDQASAVATSVVATTAVAVGTSVATSAASSGLGFLPKILDFLQGGLQTYTEESLQELEEKRRKNVAK